jgi:hypothetical protein
MSGSAVSVDRSSFPSLPFSLTVTGWMIACQHHITTACRYSFHQSLTSPPPHTHTHTSPQATTPYVEGTTTTITSTTANPTGACCSKVGDKFDQECANVPQLICESSFINDQHQGVHCSFYAVGCVICTRVVTRASQARVVARASQLHKHQISLLLLHRSIPRSPNAGRRHHLR